MTPNPKKELLKRAVELMGRDHVAARLGVPGASLDAWIRGDVTMPDGKLLVLAAVLNEAARGKG